MEKNDKWEYVHSLLGQLLANEGKMASASDAQEQQNRRIRLVEKIAHEFKKGGDEIVLDPKAYVILQPGLKLENMGDQTIKFNAPESVWLFEHAPGTVYQEQATILEKPECLCGHPAVNHENIGGDYGDCSERKDDNCTWYRANV